MGSALFTALCTASAGCGFIGVETLVSRDGDGPESLELETESPSDIDASSITDGETERPEDTGTVDLDGGPYDECKDIWEDALVCEGFEDGLPELTFLRNGTVEIDSDLAYAGNASMRAETTSEHSYAHSRAVFEPIVSGTIHFRGYFLLPAGYPTTLVKLMAFEGWDAEYDDIDADGAQLNVDISAVADGGIQVYFQMSEARFSSDAGVIQDDSWFCLSGSIGISETAGTVRVDVDGNEVINVEGENTLPPSGVSRASYGIGWTDDGQTESIVYIDNFVVDARPVPCL